MWACARSMDEAIRQDPDAPMVYWGKAWAWGPNINNGNPPERDLETAYGAIQEALKRKAKATPLERALIDALEPKTTCGIVEISLAPTRRAGC